MNEVRYYSLDPNQTRRLPIRVVKRGHPKEL